jgi:anthranilate phosphoribosyltransferase
VPEVTLAELGGWPAVLGPLVRGEDLTGVAAAAALADILEGNAAPSQIAAFATLIHAKGETATEISALLRTFLAYAEPIPIPYPVLDTCGTGGSAQRREGCFNISTIASFVVAGAGAKVAKHGGRAASATSSSADLLDQLGVAVELDAAGIARCVEETGMGFCFAPKFHPAARHAAPTRRELGVPTVFNFVLPLANPARPKRQVVGVSQPSLAEQLLEVLRTNGVERAMVFYGHDGLDELTTADTSTVLELLDGDIRTFVVDPVALGFDRPDGHVPLGGDPKRNAELCRAVLSGEKGPHRDIVTLNAAAGIVVCGLADDLVEGVALAQAVIDDGRASDVLDRLVKVSNSPA